MVSWFVSLVMLILTTIWDVERAGVAGPIKKAEALNKINTHLDDPMAPVAWPKWIPMTLRTWLLSTLIDVAVSQLQGFFGKSPTS